MCAKQKTTIRVRGDIVLEDQITQRLYNPVTNGYVLVFDTETYTDFAQKAKIAMFTMFDLDKASNNPENISYMESGMVVYDLSDSELIILQEYCTENNINLYDKETFINDIIFPALQYGVMLVGHNIPFDIGALCTDFCIVDDKSFRFKLCNCNETKNTNRGNVFSKSFNYKNLHTDITTPCNIHPTVIIEQVKTRKYVMYVEQDNQGAIIDTITLGNALLGAGKSSLDALIQRYGYEDKKKKPIESYSNEYDKTFYEYAMHDVYLTSLLIAAEYKLYKQHGINKPFYTIMSEASVGKAYNEKIGIPPFRYAHKEVPLKLYDYANQAYYGGRSETKIKMTPTETLYCDFKSQYPLVNALLKLQDYLLAEYIQVEDCQEEAQEILNSITLDDLRYKETWTKLPILVKIQPFKDILAGRPFIIEEVYKNGKIKTEKKSVYGTHELSNDTAMWYSLIDVVASKIRTGKTIPIIEAYKMVPQGKIKTNKINILGDSKYEVDLNKDDFFVKVIDLRDSIKLELKLVKKQLKETKSYELYQQKNYLSNLEKALKLMANSTSYGILVETREILRRDIAGKYNAQPLGVHITAGGRLLLAIAEQLGLDRGIIHVFCDTDSFAYARPENMEREIFRDKVMECINWFNNLSPYASTSSIFELEEYNYLNGELTELYALCVSTKRYVLYNKLDNGKYLIRKLSEHGTVPYLTNNKIKLPDNMIDIPCDELGNRLFKAERYALWYTAIEQVEENKNVTISVEEWNKQLALTQVSITTPRIYNNFKYVHGVRPFSFFTVTPQSKNKKKKNRYYMPFINNDSIINKMLETKQIYKINTDIVVDDIEIDTIQERFTDFFEHKESKFENGDSKGILHRRVVECNSIEQRIRSGKKFEVSQDTLW